MTAISKAIELSGLTKDKSAVLTSKFGSMVEQIEEWKQRAEELIITDEGQTEEIALAKDGYKFIKSVRLDIEKTRKVLKEDSLKEGRAIDLIAKSLTEEVSPLELALEQKAKFVEIEAEKRKTARTQERLERASKFGFAVPQLGMITEMSDEMFDVFLSGLKADAEKREAEQKEKAERLEAEVAIIKAERLEAERVEKERIEAQRIENEKLKIEAEKREAEIAEERRQAEAERQKQEAIREENARILSEQLRAEKERNEKIQAQIKAEAEVERVKQQAIQAKIQAEKDEEARLEREKFWKIQAKKDEQIKAEREKAEALQAEMKTKAEQEEAERKAKAKKERDALNAPDKEKLKLYLQELLESRVPVLNASESKTLFVKMANEVSDLVEKFRLEIDQL